MHEPCERRTRRTGEVRDPCERRTIPKQDMHSPYERRTIPTAKVRDPCERRTIPMVLQEGTCIIPMNVARGRKCSNGGSQRSLWTSHDPSHHHRGDEHDPCTIPHIKFTIPVSVYTPRSLL